MVRLTIDKCITREDVIITSSLVLITVANSAVRCCAQTCLKMEQDVYYNEKTSPAKFYFFQKKHFQVKKLCHFLSCKNAIDMCTGVLASCQIHKI